MANVFGFVALFSCMASIAYSARDVPAGFVELTKNLHSRCVAETGVAEDLITQGKAGVFTPDDKFKCYLKCLLATAELMPNGQPDFDGMMKLLPDDFVEVGTKMVNDCRGITGSDPCDIAWNLNLCWFKSNPDEYWLV